MPSEADVQKEDNVVFYRLWQQEQIKAGK